MQPENKDGPNEPLADSLSIVVPVYNGEGTIRELVSRLAAVLPGLSPKFEVILVNDDSPDNSREVICELNKMYPWVRGIFLMRNYGQHNATLCGLRAARGDIIVTMDDDLQHPPEEIHKLLEKLNEGHDVVYGVPAKMPHSWWRNFFSFVIKRILGYVMGIKTARDVSAFRALRARLLRAFETYQNPNVIVDVLLSWGTSRFASQSVNESPRTIGHSNYNFIRLFQYAMLILTGFSTAPLRITSTIGFFFTFFGVAVFIYVVAIFFLLGSVPGFPFLASIISLFSGTQLFALGIFGEYLARVFDRSMDRPPYVIGEVLGPSSQSTLIPSNTQSMVS